MESRRLGRLIILPQPRSQEANTTHGDSLDTGKNHKPIYNSMKPKHINIMGSKHLGNKHLTLHDNTSLGKITSGCATTTHQLIT